MDNKDSEIARLTEALTVLAGLPDKNGHTHLSSLHDVGHMQAFALAALQAKPERWGCHIDLEPGREPDKCVLELESPEDCIYARRLKSKTDCEYWKKY
jgi:hypothetical protein